MADQVTWYFSSGYLYLLVLYIRQKKPSGISIFIDLVYKAKNGIAYKKKMVLYINKNSIRLLYRMVLYLRKPKWLIRSRDIFQIAISSFIFNVETCSLKRWKP